MKSFSTCALPRPWRAAALRGARVGAAGLLALAAWPAARAQSPTTSQNYVLTNTVLVPGKTSYGAVQGMANFNPGTNAVERQQQLTYVDGLGRPVQQVQVQASPGRQDLILPITYDVLGRPATTYLPYAGGGGGSFQPNALGQQNAFYQPNGVLDHVVNDAVPSATNLYEASPLGRVLEQGAPGAAWQPGTRHTVKLNQRANYADEVRQWTYDDAASPVCSSAGTYPAGTLVVKEVRDEQGGLVTEYQDLQGRLVLRKMAGTGTTCLTQTETGTLTLLAPAGMGFVGIRSATWGTLLAGSTCDDARYDLTRRADVTSAVQSAVAAQLRNYPAPQAISVPATNQVLGVDPSPGYGKVLLVEAIYAPATAPTNTDLSTYYVYDGLDNLRLVMQPEGAASYGNTAASTSISLDDAFMRTWCFRYRYDGRRRVVFKQVPGASEQRFVYNQRNQAVLSQDGNQAAQGPPQWTFIKYDGLNRPILTGLVTLPGETQASLQTILDADYALTETPDPGSDVGYSLLNSFPRWTGWGHNPVTVDNLLTITYYDHYYYSRLQQAQLAPTVPGNQRLSRAAGLVTGSSVRTLGPTGPTSQWLTTTTYYDHTYRPLQTLAQNQLGGVTTTASTYDFSKQLSTSTTQTTSAGQAFAQTNRFTYGPANRLETTYQNTAGQGEVILSRQTYNELGQLMAKRLHNDQPNATDSYLQKVDYRYSIRGWLTHLNNRDLDNNIEDSPGVYVSDPDGPNVEPDLFGLELRYDNMLHGGATAQFNGNIAQQMWQTRNPNPSQTRNNVLRVYNYGYDGLSRVTSGDYKVWNGSTWTTSPTTDFSISGITYDKNGNLLTMNRAGTTNGSNDNPVSGWLDKLRYTYTNSARSNGALTIGNRLLAVDDLAGSNSATHDFKDAHSYANTNEIEYTYDANGNLTSDSNKSLSGVTYSVLNQPTKLDLSSNRIEYDYAATGTKLQQRTYASGSLRKTTYYAGPVVYEALAGAMPQPLFAHTGEGRVLNVGTSNSPYPWKYEYHLKDHLGNLRFAFRADRDNGTATQVVGMEPANATREERQATHVAETRLADPAHARTGRYVARLEARSGRRQGPTMRLAVQAGDSIRAEVYGRYDRDAASSSIAQRAHLLLGAAVMSAPNAPGTAEPPLPAGAGRRARLPFLGLSLSIVPQLLGLQHKKLPTAYLRYELFTKDSQLVATQLLPIRRTATDTWQQLVAGTRADSAGFVHLSLFNESLEPAYFDDLTARTVAPLPYQENHYDPFGLNLVGIETTGAPDARFQYNGKEKQGDFNLNWIDYGARMYDATLGRFHTVDRYAEKYQSFTPYQYGANNPISIIDINGDSLWVTHNTGFLGLHKETLLYEDGNLFNKNGSAYTGKVGGFLKTTLNTLSKIGAGDAGKALLNGVQSSTKNITIAQETRTNQGNNTLAAADGNSNVNFDPGAREGGVDTRDNRVRPQFIGLAHELAHALDNANGTINTNPIPGWPTITYSELFATDIENKIRAENLLPLRAYYQYNMTTSQPEFPLLNSAGLSIYNSGYDYYGANTLQSRRVLLNTVPTPSAPIIK